MDEHKNQTPQLLSAKALGQRLSLSRRQVFQLNSRGKIPAPVRIGGAVRWRADECAAWVAAGAPDRRRWEQMKGGAIGEQKRRGHTRRPTGGQSYEIIRTKVCHQKDSVRSTGNLKDQVGELLLYLQGALSRRERETCWHVFEARLRQYVAVKYRGLWL
jgi:predicted DNA-binding transcriptional regulator AlpA